MDPQRRRGRGAGRRPVAVGGSVSAKELWLPAGSSATSSSNCIAADTPTFRLLAINQGAATPSLPVEVVYGPAGKKESKVVGKISAGSAWTPTKALSLALSTAGTATSVQFRFTPLDSGRPLADRLGLHRSDHAPVAGSLAGPPLRAAALRPGRPPSRGRRSARAPCRRAGGPGGPA